MAKLVILTDGGQVVAHLPRSAEEVLDVAERHAREHNLAKRSYFPVAVRGEVEAAGFEVTDADLQSAMKQFDAVRRGDRVETIPIRATAAGGSGTTRGKGMAAKPAGGFAGSRFFETELSFPDPRARERYDRLVGLDGHKARLVLELELLLYPDRLTEWSRTHHGAVLALCGGYGRRPPLVLLEGDVGCGKTVLAETVGDALSERTGGAVHLLKVNTQVRGSGLVGEMTDLMVQAFSQAEARAVALGDTPVLLLFDEADALAAKRDEQHMHHEDKAGLNTLLQRIDGLRRHQTRVAVIFITNRPDALDPAVRRRAALQLTFGRPGDDARAEIFRRFVPELRLTDRQVGELVQLTGAAAKKHYGATFTASDVTDRLLPGALREAYADGRALTAADLLAQAKSVQPSPVFGKEAS
ncbi:MAG: ATP-binding protein [Gemmataceae bacterium]